MAETPTQESDTVPTVDNDTPDAYRELLDRVEQLSHLADAGGVLHWDQQVTMPDGGAPARAAQQAALSSLSHEFLTDDETGDLLDAAAEADLTESQEAIVRETRRSYEQETRVPGELVEEITRTGSEAQQIWQDAKADDEFAAFAPTLETLRDLHVDRAEHIDAGRDPYRVMFEGIDPDLPLDRVEAIFDDFRDELVPLI